MTSETVKRQLWGVGVVDEDGVPSLIGWFFSKQAAERDVARRHEMADYLRSIGKPAVGELVRVLKVTVEAEEGQK